MWTWFNVVYVVVLLATLISTAEVFRRRRNAPLLSAYTLVLYIAVIAFLPLVFLFGYAAGGSVGMAIVALAANAFGLQASGSITIGAAVVGIFIGSYLVGLIGVLVGAFLAQFCGKARSRMQGA